MAFEKQIEAVTEGIEALRADYATTAAEAVEARKSLEGQIDAMKEGLADLEKRQEIRESRSLPGSEATGDKKKDFSFARAVHAINTNDWRGADVEKDVFAEMQTKAQSLGTDSAGGFLVPEEHIGTVIEKLKAESVVYRAGARDMEASGSPLVIPRLSTSVAAAWGAENATITAADAVFEQVSMTPKQLSAYTKISNLLLKTSVPAADQVISDDISEQLVLGLDQGALQGTGASNQPTGIINQSGVNTSALTDAQLTYDQLIDFVDALAQDNALKGSLAWVMHPSVLKQIRILKSDNEATTTKNHHLARVMIGEGPQTTLLGYPYFVTTQLTGTSGVGADSAIFGNFADLIIARWGGMELEATRTGADAFEKNQTHVRGIVQADISVRHAESFCVAS